MIEFRKRQTPLAVGHDLRELASVIDATVTCPSQSKDLIMTSSTNAALSQWALDREIVLSRVIDARRDIVFSAWTDPKHLPNWFGPAGFKIETKEIDICVGGLWRFDMIAPDGQRFTNRMKFRRIERPTLIEIRSRSGRAMTIRGGSGQPSLSTNRATARP